LLLIINEAALLLLLLLLLLPLNLLSRHKVSQRDTKSRVAERLPWWQSAE
jgi:hypothetical protein